MRKLRENYLDSEKLFYRYFEMGNAASAVKLAGYATSCGMISPEGKQPTPMGVWKAMWRWASLKDNKDKAFEIFSHYIDNYEWKLPDNDLPWQGDRLVLWNQFMLQKIKTAWQFQTKSHLERFLRKNGWM